MSIFTFALGLIMGIGLMLGFEQYRKFKNEDERRSHEMDEILTRFKALELNKNNR